MSQLHRRHITSYRSSPLPDDYLQMVSEVIANNFSGELEKIGARVKSTPQVIASGAIYPDEILLSISILLPNSLKAVTSYASCDFDPQATSPKVDELLGLCLDGAGSLIQEFLKGGSTPDDADLEGQPLEWAPLEIEKRKIFVRIDRSNPNLDRAADDWLAANDPQARELQEEEEAETRKLFKTGKPPGGQSGTH